MKKSNTSKSQNKTEIALNESEQRYRTTMMSVGDGVIATDTEGRVEMMNPVAEELTGWKQEEARGKSLEKIFHIINEETRRTVENPVRRVMREGIVIGLANHSVLIAKDGTEHPIADSGAPIRNEKGDITGVVLVFRDQTQERMALKALQESERKFRETVKYLDEGYYSVTADGLLLDHNQAFNRILGIDMDKDMKGAKLPDFWQNPDERKVYLQELMTRGSIMNYLINAKKADGEKIIVMANAHLVKDENDRLVRIEGTFTDFTELRLAEVRLVKLNRIYTVLSDANQAIVRTRGIKELFEKVCHISVEQGGFGMAWIGLLDESSQKLQMVAQAGKTDGYLERIDISLNGAPLSYCSIDTALRQGKNTVCNITENEEMAPCQKIAYDLGFRSSASLPLKVSNTLRGALTLYSDEPKFFDEEEIKLLDEMASDISFAMEFAEKEAERKLAEEALKISKERLLFATEGANLGIWNWNIVTGELIWSDQCKALFGVPPDETMSYQRFSDALHPDDREKTDKAVKDTLDNHKDFDIEYRSLWPDESIHWLAAKGRGFYDATGKAIRLEGIVLDIAESKRTEEEIRQLNAELEDRVTKRTAQLEATNKELEAFSYSVSHDLRAPLRHVSGYVELLNKHFHSDLPEKGQHYLNSIADSVRIMGMLIDDLLQFSKTGRMEMHQSDLDMNEIVKEVIESLCKDNPDRKIEWIKGKLPSVYGDEAMLGLVWTNLLSNAVKFTRTRKKARIEIGVRKENKELVFFVRDNGVGFDMQYAKKLFGVFQRLHSTEEFEGTGIGLANVQRIVYRQGGRTWAEAEPDKGAVFYFSIPNNQEEI